MKKIILLLFFFCLFSVSVFAAKESDFVKVSDQNQTFFTHKDIIDANYFLGTDKVFYGSKEGTIIMKVYFSEKNQLLARDFKLGLETKSGKNITVTKVKVGESEFEMPNPQPSNSFIFNQAIRVEGGGNLQMAEIYISYDPLDIWIREEIDVILYSKNLTELLRDDPFISGFGARQKGTLDTTQLGSDVDANHTILYYLDPSNTEFWTTDTLGTGNGITFAQSDETTEYDFNVEAFDDADNNAWFWVEVTETFTSASDLETFIYYDGADVDNSDGIGAFPSTYTSVWHLQETSGTLGADSTSNGFDLTHVNTPTLNVQSQIDKGVTYTAASSEHSLNSTLLDAGANAVSFSFWVKQPNEWNSSSTPSEMLFQKDNTDDSDILKMQWRTNGTILFQYLETDGSTAHNLFTSKTIWAANTWFHIVGTYDSVGNVMNFYIDGSITGGGTLSEPMTALAAGTHADFFISSRETAGDFANHTLDEFKVFSGTALSADEAELIFLSESNQLITFGAEELPNEAPDVNVISPNGGETFDKTSISIITIDFNVMDTDNNSLLVDINFSTSSSEGTGTVIINDVNTDSATITCDDSDFSNSTKCSISWNISSVADNDYFILINVNDGTATDFDASDATFEIFTSVAAIVGTGRCEIDLTTNFYLNQYLQITLSGFNDDGNLITTAQFDLFKGEKQVVTDKNLTLIDNILTFVSDKKINDDPYTLKVSSNDCISTKLIQMEFN